MELISPTATQNIQVNDDAYPDPDNQGKDTGNLKRRSLAPRRVNVLIRTGMRGMEYMVVVWDDKWCHTFPQAIAEQIVLARVRVSLLLLLLLRA